jgi:PAS domain S-box-containing protein
MGNRKLTYADLEKRVLQLEKEIALEKEIKLKFKTVFENSVEGVILTDKSGTITDWNNCIARSTGINAERTVGEKIWEIQYSLTTEEWRKKYSASDMKHLWQNLITRLADGDIVTREGQYYRQDGSMVHTEDIVFPLKSGDENYLCIIQRDLTERKNAQIALKKSEEKLKDLNTTKDKLFSVIAHDLKSPFNTINGFLQLLLKSIRDADCVTSEKYVETLINSSQNAYRLLNNLLTWAGNETGMISFSPVNIDLQRVIEDVKELMSYSANLKEITINNKVRDNEMVFADENMLRTILQNLVSNAIKYTRKGGSIIIDSKLADNVVSVFVTDNGVGIKPEALEKLFDIANIHTTRGTEEEGGTGLGLLICREFVEKHGGKIGAESEPGNGSTFWFSLPDTQINKKSLLGSLKVLIVDDEPHARDLLEVLLKGYSGKILIANNGSESIEICKKNADIDLILMDKKMPEMDGYEATRQIRQFNKDVIIIALSASHDNSEKEQAINAGSNIFLYKPVDIDLLKDNIKFYFRE